MNRREAIKTIPFLSTGICGLSKTVSSSETVSKPLCLEYLSRVVEIFKKIRNTARIISRHLLPEHYRFLEEWVPDSWDDSDLYGTV